MAFTSIRAITIDYTKVVADQVDFPVLISGVYSYLKLVGNGGDVENSNGFDIIFTSDPAGTIPLDWETVNWDGSTGEVEYWVKLPAISSSTDTIFYICFGDAAITTDQSTPTAVWSSSFKLVHHYPNGSSLTTDDSTVNANDGAVVGTVAATSGEIDGAGNFPSSADGRIDVPSASSITDLALAPMTVSFWINRGTPGNQSFIINKSDGDVSAGWLLGFSVGYLDLYVVRSVGDAHWFAGTSAIQAGAWHHCAITYTGTIGAANAILYVDGVVFGWLGTLSGSGVQTSDSGQALEIGAASDKGAITGSGPNGRLDGSLDEVRLAGTVRSAEWIATEFANQSDPETFYAISSPGGCQIVVTAPTPIVISPPHTLRFQIGLASGRPSRWFPHSYANRPTVHYLDEPDAAMPNDQQLLMLSASSILKFGGNLDISTPIVTIVDTPSLDLGDQRLQKLYVDAMEDVEGTGTIGTLIQFNNAVSNGPLISKSPAGTRVQFLENISSLSDLSLYRNISARFNWTGGPAGPKINAWEPSGYIQPYISQFIVTQFINLSFPGWKHHRRLYAGYISNSALLFTIKTQDDRVYGPITLPSTSGQFRIIPLMVPQGAKDLAFAYQIDGQGQNFALFPEAFTIETKEWEGPEYINLAVWKT